MSERPAQLRRGWLNRWKAAFGMSDAEVLEARRLRMDAKIPMAAACRITVRSVDRISKRSSAG